MAREEKTIFAKNLEYYLSQYDKKPIDLARELDFKRTTVYSWLYRGSYPNRETLQIIADHLGVKISDLMESDTSKYNLNEQDYTIYKKIFENEKSRQVAQHMAAMSDEELDKLLTMIKLIKGE